MVSLDDIKLFCQHRKVKYISHVDNGDGSISITTEYVIRTTDMELEPYVQQIKLMNESNPLHPPSESKVNP